MLVMTEIPGRLDRPTALIDLGAVTHNVRVVARHAPTADVMAVLKADGYGHGAVPVARAALAGGATELGVTTVDEALVLRDAGITVPILSWLSTSGYERAIAADVRIGVSSPRQLAEVLAAAGRAGAPAVLHVKVDTGLNRNGVAPHEWATTRDALVDAERAGLARLQGVFTHLAHGDEPDHPFLDVQRDALAAAAADARAHGLYPTQVHAANSAAALTRPDLHFDLVRPGIAIYGGVPVPDRDFGLRPVMTFAAPVILVKPLAAGDGVSYGHTWIAPRDTVVGLVPAGYADGVWRPLSGRFEVTVQGRRFPQVGRVCMDQFVIDLGPDGGGVSEGDTAVLFGAAPGAARACDWGEKLGTIDYEVLTAVRGRVHREYTGQS
ncbi:Alanine racemase OS=Tsukamurella paurometabola (strain ATCC 8368 / DSM / CCUG 35730 / CIP 100753/ JCM 10117 / KCTC 9821 / NBRC 16120 / NCIMB 702349 / NCTC 13040) OX=521096 GN=Tpau_0878 PE=3 SV=1 [Tsukamurella paurometabola]|uniref:Alanine racemase n=1 Tax=Tsukamurella paurometabola (strain ATCC 8368 / DSM 20162 / CCUG 35730 / CIP 100753 / JCM 10117 / KCTC 9821 / NBRC 16120 / NCIMB 702349 / NCTC 13040) TaxID=521096 RepID=D5UUE1_TSUPD|nr:alanine racemase [Tsukamurella paurometabola DSM 20162]SUP27498.1 Alanine racemase [Tsukamurella paurometabola]